MARTLASAAAMAAISTGLAFSQASLADEVVFTAGVPNGATLFPNIVQFGVGNDSNEANAEVHLGAGVTGNGVVASMEIDLENVSLFDGAVAGNSLTVGNANQAWAQAAAEIDLSFSVDHDGGGGVGPSIQIKPRFWIEPPDFDHSTAYALVLVIGDEQGDSVVAGAAGSIAVMLTVDGTPVSAQVDFDADTTTAEISRGLNALLDAMVDPLPSGIARYNLEDAWPRAFVSTRPFDLSVGYDVRTDGGGQVDFLLGAAAVAVPEPGTLGLLTVAAGTCLLRRRVR